MLALLRQRNYALFLSGGFVSQIGTYMLIAALPYYVYAVSHSVAASGAALVSEMLPGAVFNMVGGLFADRLPRKVLLAAGNGSRGLIILPLLAVHGPSTLWIVYLVGFANQTIAAFAGPFGNAALPRIVRSEELPAANGGLSAASSTAVLIGSPLGGLLLQQAGLASVVLVDAVSFAAPTVAILLINVALEDPRRSVPSGAFGQMGMEMLLGWRYVRQNPIVAGVVLVTSVNLVGAGLFFVGFAPFVRHVLGGSPEFYSWALTLQGISGIAGALAMARAARLAGPRVLVAGSLITLGLLALIEVIVARQVVTLALALLYGFPAEFNGASQNVLLQVGTADAYRGRVYGTFGTVSSLSLLLGASLATVTGDRIGIRPMLIGGSLLLLLSGFIAVKVIPVKRPGAEERASGTSEPSGEIAP